MGENMKDQEYRSSSAPDVFPEPFSASVSLPAAPGNPPAEVRDKYSTRFKPGNRANPAGRPKLTEEQKEIKEQLRALGPKAVEAAKKMLESDRVSSVAKVQIISLVLAYAIGRPESTLKLAAEPQQSIQLTEARVEALIRSIRIENGAAEKADAGKVLGENEIG